MQKKILIADDDKGILEVLQLILEDAGYEVETTDGHRDWQMKQGPPDMFLLDICMSGINGLDICRQLKKQSITKHIPVIIISANTDLASCAREAGAEDFIEKPFEVQALLQKVTLHTDKTIMHLQS